MNKVNLIIVLLLIVIVAVSCQINVTKDEAMGTGVNSKPMTSNNNEINLSEGEIQMSGSEILIDEILTTHVKLFGIVLFDMEYNDDQVYNLSIEIWRDGAFTSSVGVMSNMIGN